VQDRLAVTLRYFATGDTFTSLQYLFRISKQIISSIVADVCGAIINGLKEHTKVCISCLYCAIYYPYMLFTQKNQIMSNQFGNIPLGVHVTLCVTRRDCHVGIDSCVLTCHRELMVTG
jgi:hypothetical protein